MVSTVWNVNSQALRLTSDRQYYIITNYLSAHNQHVPHLGRMCMDRIAFSQRHQPLASRLASRQDRSSELFALLVLYRLPGTPLSTLSYRVLCVSTELTIFVWTPQIIRSKRFQTDKESPRVRPRILSMVGALNQQWAMIHDMKVAGR